MRGELDPTQRGDQGEFTGEVPSFSPPDMRGEPLEEASRKPDPATHSRMYEDEDDGWEEVDDAVRDPDWTHGL